MTASEPDSPKSGPNIPSLPRRVVVKFEDDSDLTYEDGVEKRLLDDWSVLSREFPGITLRKLFRSLEPTEIEKWAKKAESEAKRKAEPQDESKKPPSLLRYFSVECPQALSAQSLARKLRSVKSVERAYVESGPVPPPAVTPDDETHRPNQQYLDAELSQGGVDAVYAWDFIGPPGTGPKVVDIEWGWTLNHEDLPNTRIQLISGQNALLFGHGTSVLGVIAADDNARGCIGIIPNLASIGLVSQWRTLSAYSTADAILSAIPHLGFGDVLLLEAQTNVESLAAAEGDPSLIAQDVPVELEEATFQMIRMATSLGIVVVEAAGNGNKNLDTVKNSSGLNVLLRTLGDGSNNLDFKDSGAILVSAAYRGRPHHRYPNACHGDRVDCYAWGEQVTTTGDGWGGNTPNAYTFAFGGTSAAAAIVAGVALAVQDIEQIKRGARFSPERLREILRDPTYGTLPAASDVGRIGVMPDLRKIIDGAIGV